MTSRGLCEQKCEKRALRSSRAFGRKRAVSGCVKVVVGWILVTHGGNGGRRSFRHRHGVGVKNGVKRGSEADCRLNSMFCVFTCFQIEVNIPSYNFGCSTHIQGGLQFIKRQSVPSLHHPAGQSRPARKSRQSRRRSYSTFSASGRQHPFGRPLKIFL